jgi:hypothetical protein
VLHRRRAVRNQAQGSGDISVYTVSQRHFVSLQDLSLMKNDTKAVVLSGVTFEDMQRALEFTGIAISRTLDPHVYVVTKAPRRLPTNLDMRRQAN